MSLPTLATSGVRLTRVARPAPAGCPFVAPATAAPLREADGALVSTAGDRFPIVGGIPRFCEIENYTSSFGRQWNLFEKTQIDREGTAEDISARRLFAETGWNPDDLDGLDILEVGSGAGRFSRAILEHSRANLYSVDYSSAVEANLRNNARLGRGRLWLAQASVYELPFPDGRFDKVLCLGVLQHTPDFEAAVAALIAKAKPGGEIVVDFYPVRGWWTRIHAKYLLRPLTRRIDHDRLLRLIERNVDWLIRVSAVLNRMHLGVLTRFLPLVDQRTLPPAMSAAERRETSVLDTFDMFSPAYDRPRRVDNVAGMFERHGARPTFAGFVSTIIGDAAVVRAVKVPGKTD
jgi:SAM-dependent methyltransferase